MFQRFSLFAPLVLALALNSSSIAHARDSSAQAKDRRAIVAAQGRIDGARERSDIPTLMNYVADDFRFYSIARLEQDRETYGRIQTNFARFSQDRPPANLRVQTSVNNWQWRGPDAVIYTTTQITAGGKGHSLSGTVRNREYWGKIGGRWQLRQLVEIMGQLTIDGETIEM